MDGWMEKRSQSGGTQIRLNWILSSVAEGVNVVDKWSENAFGMLPRIQFHLTAPHCF